MPGDKSLFRVWAVLFGWLLVMLALVWLVLAAVGYVRAV